MAIQLVSAIKRYIGTAAEVAAFSLVGIPVGSTFFESDTGILKVLNAAGALVTAPGETIALSGSIPEYGWLSTDTPPTPAGFAMGVEIDTIADTMTVKYWNGTAWKAVV